jgi:transposase-like protein
MATIPKTLQEAIVYFSDPENCREYMLKLRWPDGKVTCPRCGSVDVSYLPNARVYKCYAKPAHAQSKFSLKVGTIFEDSPIGLDKWLPVMWMVVNCKNGVSSWEIHRSMGVTQKSAWFMLQRCRLAMQEAGSKKMSGTVEADETFIGGKARNMHVGKRTKRIHGRGPGGKEIVFGLLERKTGKVRVQHVEGRRKHHLVNVVRENVRKGSEVMTDELLSYDALNNEYAHKVINHAERYVDGHVHTNRMENFWSLLKRGINGTYVSVEPFHLFRYLDEQAFRFNNCKDLDDSERFELAMRGVIGKRLSYAELTGKTEEGSTEATIG